jgi:hypothetical protein
LIRLKSRIDVFSSTNFGENVLQKVDGVVFGLDVLEVYLVLDIGVIKAVLAKVCVDVLPPHIN